MKKFNPNNAMVRRSLKTQEEQYLPGTDTMYYGSPPAYTFFDRPNAQGVVNTSMIKIAAGIPFVRAERMGV